MNRIPAFRSRAALAILALLVAVVATSCFNPFSPLIAPVRGFVAPPPAPTSAPNVLRLFEWCYNNKAIAEYREIFTDDYRFVFNPQDSAGAAYRGVPWTREDELISTTQLFVGGGVESPASTISLNLDKNFNVFPDLTLAPWDLVGRWHKTIRTQVLLNIRTSDGNAIDISGQARFYFVRGDSATIPEELKLKGFGRDSTRWYILRWDDETVQPGGARPVGPGVAARSGVVTSAMRFAPAATLGALPARSTAAGVRRPVSALAQPDFALSWGTLKVDLLQQANASGP